MLWYSRQPVTGFGLTFAPTVVHVSPGATVLWTNSSPLAHTVTADDGSFDSGNLDPSEGFSWFFSDPGTFPYVCALHPWMKGKVIVGDGIAVDAPPPPDAPPPADNPVPADAAPAD